MDVSIIIPVLNEADRIEAAIDHARSLNPCEVIVVDGNSSDDTFANAESADIRLTSIPGRAIQQNAGAERSSGDVLLFLHADCRVAPSGLASLGEVLADSQAVAGCFRQKIDADGLKYRLLEHGNLLRVRWWKWAYGDQGIFVRRDVFERIGGFPSIGLMEDLYLMKRLKREGRVCVVDHDIHVSARRWQKAGVVRQTLRNWTLVTLAQMGISPDRLTRFYPNVR